MWNQKGKIVLASSSPRRRELLNEIGLTFSILSPDVDETLIPEETPEAMVVRLSQLKASAVHSRDSCIIAADTTVVLDGEILGKPSSTDEAFSMLSKTQGRWHTVLGGVSMAFKERRESFLVSTDVKMVPMTDREIARYIETHEPMDKAGAYAIQGIGLQFVSEIKGSYTNVVGLSIPHVVSLLKSYEVIE